MVTRDVAANVADQNRAATRITLRPHDPGTGEEVEKAEVVKGYEYYRGRFVTFTASAVRLTCPKFVNDQRLDEDRALSDEAC
jgi:non-homologous end joining protein Ku